MFPNEWRRWLGQFFRALFGRKNLRAPVRRQTRRPAVELLEDRVVPAAVLTSTLDDQTATAVDTGDTIQYLATVSNTGDANATGVLFTLDLDDNAPLVTNTLSVGPHARRDAYTPPRIRR